ncbi:trypsin-like serine protease [Nitzschia inconspicua]|uniref:Trypsin-like serine protease n=1 Tax=Nitzschia inconspicua TaxID=303405 RepID=A0A9K3KAA4_9STRA|nr:trypsin-like serine protease [Nitzschia inconspicua]
MVHVPAIFLSTLLSAVVMRDAAAAASIKPYPLETNGQNGEARRLSKKKVTNFGEIKALAETKGYNGGVGGQESSLRPQTKIVGGNDADYGEYEYYVQLFSGTTGLLCGGSLIAPNVVLTAAHCFTENLQYVSVGSDELALTYGVENGYSQHARITAIAIHPSYEGHNSLEYDIMLLKLDENLTQFKPLSLNFDDSLPRVGDAVTVIGLGMTDAQDQHSVPDTLQELTLEIVPSEECFPPGSILNDYVNGAVEFCASSPGKMGGKGHCFGDSGGPAFAVDSSGEHIQMGVVSWVGSLCAAPGDSSVYSRVSTSRDFISSVVCDAFRAEAPFCSMDTDSGSLSDTESDLDNSDGGTGSSPGGESNNGNTEATASCSSSETYFFFEIKVDAYGSEVSWDLADAHGSVIYTDGGFADGETRAYEGCLSRTASACLYLSIYDSYGDGMGHADNGEGAYIGVIFGQSTYFDLPQYTSQFTFELCH